MFDKGEIEKKTFDEYDEDIGSAETNVGRIHRGLVRQNRRLEEYIRCETNEEKLKYLNKVAESRRGRFKVVNLLVKAYVNGDFGKPPILKICTPFGQVDIEFGNYGSANLKVRSSSSGDSCNYYPPYNKLIHDIYVFFNENKGRGLEEKFNEILKM